MDASRAGERIRALRDEKFLSVAELAREAGITRATLHNIETGKHVPMRSTIRAIAQALDVAPAELVA